MASAGKRQIVDAHLHLIDHSENHYEFLEHMDASFEALIGDYSALPRQYLLDDYLRDAGGLEVAGLVWHEMLSSDPVREVQWAQKMAERVQVPMSIVGLADFLSPQLEARLEAYSGCRNASAVREHLGWDAGNPLRRFAKRSDLLTDPQWRRGLATLKRFGFRCSLEVFAHQLPDLLAVVQLNPEIGFTIAVMGWPVRTDAAGFAQWKRNLAALSACQNTRITISAIEVILGMDWQTRGKVKEIAPWVRTVFELFGPERTMFGSHRPISGLAASFEALYTAYELMSATLSESEQDAVFRGNAAEWFRVPAPMAL